MTLSETTIFFENLITESTNKSEIKVCEKFLRILTELKLREFSKDEIKSIETELDSLNFNSNPKNRKKIIKSTLAKFEKYLKDTFSLTSKGYYSERGVSYGVLFGVVAGTLIGERFERSLGISFGIGFGMLIGALIGRHMDSQAIAAGNIL